MFLISCDEPKMLFNFAELYPKWEALMTTP